MVRPECEGEIQLLMLKGFGNTYDTKSISKFYVTQWIFY